MGAKEFFSRGWPTRLAFYLGKYLPPRGGRYVADLVARTIVSLKPDLYCAVRTNLCQVLGEDASEQRLNRLVYQLFRHAARGYYDLFHNVGRGKALVEDFRPPVRLSEDAKVYLQQGLDSGRGLFILGCHMSNFDLSGIGLSQFLPVPMQALSLAEPAPGFDVFNRLREKGGAFVTPISPRTLRDAMERLRNGGVVITGVDRPIGEGDEPVEFFGATAHLPTGYIRIPLRTDCLTMTASTVYEDGVNWIVANPPMEMERTGDRQRDIEHNLRCVLTQVEDFIRSHPDQWMMFIPVWPNGCDR